MWSVPTVLAGPVESAIPIEAAKEFLRIEPDDFTFDGELRTHIEGVIEDAERVSGTRLITQTVLLVCDELEDLQRLPVAPIQSVISLAYDDAEGLEQTVDPADFRLAGSGLSWSIEFSPVPPAIAARKSAIHVHAIVGYGDSYASIPAGLFARLLRAVRGMFDDRPVPYEELLVNHRIWL